MGLYTQSLTDLYGVSFITGNEGKRREVEQILGANFNVINIKLDLPEIQSISDIA